MLSLGRLNSSIPVRPYVARTGNPDLVTAHHLAHKACVFEDHTLQVLNVIMLANTLAIALKDFIHNLEACVFLLRQKITDFPRKKRLTISIILSLSRRSALAIQDNSAEIFT